MSELVGSNGTPVELSRRLQELGCVDVGNGCWSHAGGTPRHWTEMVGPVSAPAAVPAPVVVHAPAHAGFSSSLAGTTAISAAAAGVAVGLQHLDTIPPEARPYIGLVLLILAAALATVKGMQLYGQSNNPPDVR